MKQTFYHWYNALLASLLTMLGFEACIGDGLDEYGAPPVEYGTPHAHYVVRGAVTDAEGQPVEGIKASVRAVYDKGLAYDGQPTSYGLDSALTDRGGAFQVEFTDHLPNPSLKLVLEDVDGAANGGEFENDTVALSDMALRQLEKGQGWYEGTYELSKTVKLKRKP